MRILILDDDSIKLDRISRIIKDARNGINIDKANNIADGIIFLQKNIYDLLILDLNIPLRRNEEPKKNAGLRVLTELKRNQKELKQPMHIIGLTSYENLKKENNCHFEEYGWVLISYDDTESRWEETILNKMDHIMSTIDCKKEKILFLSASPVAEARLRVDNEYKQIDERLAASTQRNNLELISKTAIDFNYASQAILNERPHYLHFSGHGNKLGVAIETQDGDTKLLTKDSIYRLLDLYKTDIRCAVFNACYSSDIAQKISSLGFYAIGMNESIQDSSAIDFAVGFYQGIGAGENVVFAFKLGLAHISANDEKSVHIPTLWKDGVEINTDI